MPDGTVAAPAPMPDAADTAPALDQTASSTQAGAIAECLVAAAIMEASRGRLSPFKPLADDDGIDLLLLDKLTGRATPLQIKGRRSYDDDKAQTTQFDVRLKTFKEDRRIDYLFIKLDGLRVEMAWLIPAGSLRSVARPTGTTLVSVPCCRSISQDRFTPYRRASMNEVVAEILARAAP
ncbi:MAG: uncharacterized protein JWR38_5896 [Mucilaginibacter sp.]|nr:uncharacterized protein [Mucilaginibacter sp.]